MSAGIEVAGVRTRLSDPKASLAEVQAFARSQGGWAQLLDAGHVCGVDHVVSAWEHAKRAFDQGTNTTSSIEMELLLYASGERQISKAIQRSGVRPGKPFVLVLVGTLPVAEALAKYGWSRDDRLLRPTPAKLRALGLSPAEIAACGAPSDLALERVARVDLTK